MAGKSKQQDSHLPSKKNTDGNDMKIFTTKRKIIKNLFVVCFGFLLLFTAFSGLNNLQSTLNQKQGIGVVSQAIIYAGFCVSALLLPKYTIKKLGCKRTLVLSMSFYIPYIASNIYFTWLTMVPSAILLGLAASLVWSSQCTYFNESSVIYSKLCFNEIKRKEKHSKNHELPSCGSENGCNTVEVTQDSIEKLLMLNVKQLQNENDHKINCDGETCVKTTIHKEDKNRETKKQSETFSGILDSNLKDYDVKEEKMLSEIASHSEEYSKIVSSVTARFFGLFGLIFLSSIIWSNLISYYVLDDNIVLDNITENGSCSCGASFCNVESECFSHNLEEPTQQMRNILSGASVLLACFAVLLVLLFLDELEKDKEPVTFSFNLAMATCKFISRKEALFLIPLTSYTGLLQGFYSGDFTKSYIACAWGIYHIGLVTIIYGVFSGVSATVAGFATKYIGRILVMIIGAVINDVVCIFLLIWNPMPDQPSKFFITAAMLGASVGILWSQVRVFYGVIFKEDEEAAFAMFGLWDSIGHGVAFAYSNYICTYLKIYILLFLSTIGMIGYLKTESIYMQKQKEPITER